MALWYAGRENVTRAKHLQTFLSIGICLPDGQTLAGHRRMAIGEVER